VWGSELEPLYVLDLGDRLLNLGLWHIRGRASGVPLDQELAQLVTCGTGSSSATKTSGHGRKACEPRGWNRRRSRSHLAGVRVKQRAAPHNGLLVDLPRLPLRAIPEAPLGAELPRLSSTRHPST
jgi:hypothetical protein